jgi:hypothetical protein
MSAGRDTAFDLLVSLSQRGIRLSARDGQLHFDAPKGSLLAVDIAALRSVKSELMALLLDAPTAQAEPVTRRDMSSLVPMTAMQKVIWNILAGSGEKLNERWCTVAVRICGKLDIGRLRESIETVTRRHETLRTRIVVSEGIPRQQVDSARECSLEIVDLRRLGAAALNDEAGRIIGGFAQLKIALSVGPLFEAKLLSVADAEHILVLALDAMISDGLSNSIVIEEIWRSYGAGGIRQIVQTQPGVQYADYALWQEKTHASWLSLHGRYWNERLSGAPSLELPVLRALKVANDEEGALFNHTLGCDLVVALRDLARQERTSLAFIVLTVYVAVMSRWCGQTEMMVELVENGRHLAELERMVGRLVQVLYLRVEAKYAASFRDLLSQLLAEYHSASAHRDLGRAALLSPQCLENRNVNFNWHPPAVEYVATAEAEAGALQVRQFPEPFGARIVPPAFEFLPFFFDTSADVRVAIVHRPEIVSRAAVVGFCDNLGRFAKSFVRDPSCRLGSVGVH